MYIHRCMHLDLYKNVYEICSFYRYKFFHVNLYLINFGDLLLPMYSPQTVSAAFFLTTIFGYIASKLLPQKVLLVVQVCSEGYIAIKEKAR